MSFTTSLPFVDTLPESAEIVEVRSGLVLTLAQIRASVSQRAVELMPGVILPAGPVVVAEKNGVQALLSLFAAWASGRMAVMVNPGLAPPEKANVIAHSGAVGWLSDGGSIEPVMAPESTPLLSAMGRQTGEAGIGLSRDAPCLMMMTSGTTGHPKGIVHSLRTLEARIALNIAHIGPQVLRDSLCVLPVFFGHGLIGNCMTPLAAGGRLCLWNGPGMAEISSLAEHLTTHKISFMSSVPTFWRLALRTTPPESGILKRVHVGSAPLSLDHWQAIADWVGTYEVYNLFGMTETANWIAGASLAAAHGRNGHVGRIWGGTFAIHTDDGVISQSGRGEVLVASPSIMLGYFGNEELNREAFVGGWFRTGDIGELENDGSLTLVGRMKTEINRAGIKILAEEIDMMLERHPAVAEACAFGYPDPVAGEAVGAAIVLVEGDRCEAAAIRLWCRDQVRAEAVPQHLVIVDAIPRNDRGKIVRSDVRDAVFSGKG